MENLLLKINLFCILKIPCYIQLKTITLMMFKGFMTNFMVFFIYIVGKLYL